MSSKVIYTIDQEPIQNVPIVALDFETTGLDVTVNRAIEIAISKRHPNGSIEHWSSLINPQMTIPITSQMIHGINNRMVYNAPTFEQLYSTIEMFLQGSIIVAHNAQFDINFLNSECMLTHSQPIKIGPVVDTLRMSRNFLGLQRNNLSSVAHRFQLRVHDAHRALHDAHNTLYCFLAMLDDLEEKFGQGITHHRLQELLDVYQKDGEFKKTIKSNILKAKKQNKNITIEYISSNPLKPLRTIRMIKIEKINFPEIIAYCYLRQDIRKFHLSRIQNANFEDTQG